MMVEECVINGKLFKKGDRIEDIGVTNRIIRGVVTIGKILVKDDYKVIYIAANNNGKVTRKSDRIYDDNEIKHAILCEDNVYRSSVTYNEKTYVCDNKPIEPGCSVIYQKNADILVGTVNKVFTDSYEIDGQLIPSKRCFYCKEHK